ncbi:growth arrest-specific protein 1-like [Sinocyclocheilus rhinocerous]|uniref:growth arrest-specific protein 1-like n=1 Tax=Sinocyclocheilus rhinocerous TaxID=307959 RepID=UPI0007B9624E|nr:PREDICTED: growth arrest-specific protein 1-like [Sinocyclocheilus rhinocerous]
MLAHQGMANSGNSAVILRLQIMILSIGCALICYSRLSTASPAHNQRLICWQAIMKCQGEPECHYAYTQYLHACGPVINGSRKKCPSHCISSIIQLNLTVNGPALEDCECASDTLCKMTKRAIEPCMPRTSHMGCTEARKQCEKDPGCSTAMRDYLYHCRKLFGGERCSDDCRRVITNMRSIPKAQQLDTCVCDGTERTICEYVKVSMKNFCFNDRYGGSGFSDTEDDLEVDYETEYENEESDAWDLRAQKSSIVVSTILTLSSLVIVR